VRAGANAGGGPDGRGDRRTARVGGGEAEGSDVVTLEGTRGADAAAVIVADGTTEAAGEPLSFVAAAWCAEPRT
jgi:hypothetical protein